MSGAASETLSMTIGGQRYYGWTEMRLTRRIDNMASEFEISVSERWNGQTTAWQIGKFDPCVVYCGSDPVLTGYVDVYEPQFGPDEHRVRITGRSKTCDLIDCMPDLPSGQFKGYALDAVARAMAAPFGISVVVATKQDLSALTDTMLDRCETAYEFLERLGRLSGVLLCDDEQGRLVLATTGTARAHDTLVQGGNVWRASAKLDGRRQFSRYVMKGQHPINAASSTVQTGQQAVASDPSVPRFRQKVSYAESALTAAQMQERVHWQAVWSAARSTQARITVPGWRQSDGSLWTLNTLVATTVPYLEIAQDMLIAGTTMILNAQGQFMELLVGPPEGYTPDPAEVKVHKAHRGRKGGSAIDWSGAGGIQ